MDKETKKLSEAFRVKEEAEGFLVNLEKLKADGSITEEQYAANKEEYYERLGETTSEIARIKNQFKRQLEANHQEIETCRSELSNLEVKYKVGELPLGKYQSSEKKLRARIEELEQYSGELTGLIEANTATDIGAAPKKPRAAAPESKLPAEAAPPAKATTPQKGVKPRRGKLMAIIGAVVVVIVAVVLAVVLLAPDEGGKAGLPSGGFTEVKIPVAIQGAANVGSLHFELVYNESVLHAVGVEKGTVVGGALFEYNVDVPGRVIVGLVDINGISGDGSIAIVTFQASEENEITVNLDLSNIAAHAIATLAEIPATYSAGSFTSAGGSYVSPILILTSTPGQ